jgi:tRNA (adenine37-N6)-methyltransferase
MVRLNEIRSGEVAVEAAPPADAALVFIGRIHTPWHDRLTCPRQGRPDGPTCRIEVFEPWAAALDGIAKYQRIEVLYWLHLSRAISSARVRATTALRAARSACARRGARTRSEPSS